jgi:hypothetical protein
LPSEGSKHPAIAEGFADIREGPFPVTAARWWCDVWS